MGFELGKVVSTYGIFEMINENEEFGKFVCDSFERYTNSDWGEMCDEDKELNDEAVKTDGRIFASYEKDGLPKIWIITEWDRSATTILFPSEY